jgi:hypothetical protein
MRCAICLHLIEPPDLADTVHERCVGPCTHPIADQKIIGSIVGSVFRKPGDQQVTAVTFRCASCGEHTTVTLPPRKEREARNGTDASHDPNVARRDEAQR